MSKHSVLRIDPITVTVYPRPTNPSIWVVEIDTEPDHEPNDMLSVWINDDNVHMPEEDR